MEKEICFDMDGTLNNFYEVEGWLEDLRNYSVRPYKDAKARLNLSRLAKLLNKLQKDLDFTLTIVSWCSKESTPEFDKRTKEAKLWWLKKHMPSVEWDKICIVPYGTPKHEIGKGLLFDDNKEIREEWGKGAYSEKEIFDILNAVLRM